MRIFVDARWIGHGGIGKVTELFLRGLHDLPQKDEWSVWGPDSLKEILPASTKLITSKGKPGRAFSQADLFQRVGSPYDAAFFPHQLRPLRRYARREVTIVHDTIPLRFPSNRLFVRPYREYLRVLAKRNDMILTDSEFSRTSISRDLKIDSSQICVVSCPLDFEWLTTVRQRREQSETEKTILYVGADAPHKNLDGLIRAFLDTRAAMSGYRLKLIGISKAGCDRLAGLFNDERVHLVARLSQRDLENEFSSACLLVQPSFEEGFGLPVAEAWIAGLKVAASSGGSLPEVTNGLIPLFDPRNVSKMTEAIDEALGRTMPPHPPWPSPSDFAGRVYKILVGNA